MNLKLIADALNSGQPNEEVEYMIIQILAQDKHVVPNILSILKAERDQRQEIESEMNLLLSKSATGLENPKFNKDGFMQKEISEFYKKYKGTKGIFNCFEQ